MYITYHQIIKKPDEVTSSIPHIILHPDIQNKLKEWNVVQERYYFYDNDWYFFIYLDNGDRVDVSMS